MNRQELEDLVSQKLSTRKIAKLKECSQSTVKYWLKKFNLKTYVPEKLTEEEVSKRNVERVQNKRRGVKIKAVEYKGGKCNKCGYNKCLGAMEFHHLDPKEKDFSIGNKGYTRSWDKVKEELDKCVLLCANCHREEHNKDC